MELKLPERQYNWIFGFTMCLSRQTSILLLILWEKVSNYKTLTNGQWSFNMIFLCNCSLFVLPDETAKSIYNKRNTKQRLGLLDKDGLTVKTAETAHILSWPS